MTTTSPDTPELIVPTGLLEDKDPLHAALIGPLTQLEKSMEHTPGQQFNFVPVVWCFREIVDIVTVVMASAAVSPLSAGDVPLPGWRRSLWKSEFSSMASGLLSWAVAYLPRRSRQNALASAVLDFLFEDGDKHVTGEPRSYAGLIGTGTSSGRGAGAWLQFRDRFFSCRDAASINRQSRTILSMFPALNDMLQSFDTFLNKWSIETAVTNNVGRIVLRSGDGINELPSFAITKDCPECSKKNSLFILVSPRIGERFLYREIGTNHLLGVEADLGFRRRFFTSPPSAQRASLSLASSSGSSSHDDKIIPLTLGDESVTDLKEKLVGYLSAEVYEKYHVPLLSVICQAKDSVPLSVLATPNFGCRDGEAVAYRLNGFLSFDEENQISIKDDLVREEVLKNYPDLCKSASGQLALWAEDILQSPESNKAASSLAVQGLAGWAVESKDPERIKRLAGQNKDLKFLFDWLEEAVATGTHERRDLAMKVSQDWIGLLTDSGVDSHNSIVKLRLFRAGVFRQTIEYSEAREELDKALLITEGSTHAEKLKALVIKERTRINLDLDLPGLAAEDGALAANIWSKMVTNREPGAIQALAEVTNLRAKALMALGHRAQAISVMQKVVETKASPRSPEEAMVWVSLNLELAELLLEQQNNPRLVKTCFERVLNFIRDVPENSKVREAKARALKGLVEGKEPQEAISDLMEAKEVFKQLIFTDNRLDLKPNYTEVLSQLAGLLERESQNREALENAMLAATLLTEQMETAPSLKARAGSAKLFWQIARLSELLEQKDVAREALYKAESLFTQLIEDDAQTEYETNLAEILSSLGFMSIEEEDYFHAREQLGKAVDKWLSIYDLDTAPSSLAKVFQALADVCVNMKDSKGALDSYDKAIHIAEVQSERSLKRTLIGRRVWVLMDSGFPKKAQEDFTTLLLLGATQEDEKTYSINRAVARLRSGDFEQSLQDFEELLKNEPDNLSYLAGKGLSILSLMDSVMSVKVLLQLSQALEDYQGEDRKVLKVIADGGLAIVYEHLKNNSEARASYNTCAQDWELEDENFDSLSDEELFKLVGIFHWEIAKITAKQGHFFQEQGESTFAIRDLKAAYRLLAKPGVLEECRTLRLNVGCSLAKVYASTGRDGEAVSFAQKVLKDASLGEVKDQSLIAWLNFLCGELSVATKDFSEETTQFLDKAISIYTDTIKNPNNVKDKSDLALTHLLRGIVKAQKEDFHEALEDHDIAVDLLSDLRHRMEGRGLEWETGLAVLNRALVNKSLGSVDSAVYDLGDILELLPHAAAPIPSNIWVRREFVTSFANFIPKAIAGSTIMCRVVGEIVSLSIWDWFEAARFEQGFSMGISSDISLSSWPVISQVAVAFSNIKVPQGQPTGGYNLVKAWLDLSFSKAGEGSVDAVQSLKELADLGVTAKNVKGWPLNFAVSACESLADLFSSEGNIQRAVDSLNDATKVISPEVNSSERTKLLFKLGLRRGELLLRLEQMDEVTSLARKLKGYCEKLKDDGGEELESKVRELSQRIVEHGGPDIFAPIPEPVEEKTETAEMPAVSPIAPPLSEEKILDNAESMAAIDSIAAGIAGAIKNLPKPGEDKEPSKPIEIKAPDSIPIDLPKAQDAQKGIDIDKKDEELKSSEDLTEKEEKSTEKESIQQSSDSGIPSRISLDIHPSRDNLQAIPIPVNPPIEKPAPSEVGKPFAIPAPKSQESLSAVAIPAPKPIAPKPIAPKATPKPIAPPQSTRNVVSIDNVANVAAALLGVSSINFSVLGMGDKSKIAINIGEKIQPKPQDEQTKESKVIEAPKSSGEIKAQLPSDESSSKEAPEKEPVAAPEPDFTLDADKDQNQPGELKETDLSEELKAEDLDKSLDSQSEEQDKQSVPEAKEQAPTSDTLEDTVDAPTKINISPEVAISPEINILQHNSELSESYTKNAEIAQQALSDERAEQSKIAAQAQESSDIENLDKVDETQPEEELDSKVEDLNSDESQDQEQEDEASEEPYIPKVQQNLDDLDLDQALNIPAPEASPKEPEVFFDSQQALDRVDQGLYLLDSGNIQEAEQIFGEIGKNFQHCDNASKNTLAAALLEGLFGSAEAYMSQGWTERALTCAENGCNLGNTFLASSFDFDAWPWWGDIEFMAGRYNYHLGDFEKACAHLSKAKTIYLEMLNRGAGEDSRVDAFRVMAQLAAALQETNRFQEALTEYTTAIENGLQVLMNNFKENATVASLHMARGRLFIQLHYLDEAQKDYEWAMEFYARDTEDLGTDHNMELAAVWAGLSEVHILLNNPQEAYKYRQWLATLQQNLLVNGNQEASHVVAASVARIDDLVQRFM